MTYLEKLATIYVLVNSSFVAFAFWRDVTFIKNSNSIDDHREARRRAEAELHSMKVQLMSKRSVTVDGKIFELMEQR